MPVIRFRYARPDQRGFSFCKATIKSRKQFAARKSHKGDGCAAVWAILFNDGTLKRRGHLIYFRHELRQIPLPSAVTHFRQENSPPTDYGTLFLYQKSFLVRTGFICSLRVSTVSLTVRSPWSVTALSTAHFRSQQPGTLLYIAPSPTQLDCSANSVTVTGSFQSHCFVLTVSHLALVKTPGNHLINASFSDYPSHSFCKRVSFIWTPPS